MDTVGERAEHGSMGMERKPDVLPSGPRRRRSILERRQIVEETLEAGSSVARVARRHGINANQVFQWRTLYRKGRLGSVRPGEVKLLPVAVSDVEDAPAAVLGEPAEIKISPISKSAGAIRIKLRGGTEIVLEGSVETELVRAVFECLHR